MMYGILWTKTNEGHSKSMKSLGYPILLDQHDATFNP